MRVPETVKGWLVAGVVVLVVMVVVVVVMVMVVVVRVPTATLTQSLEGPLELSPEKLVS